MISRLESDWNRAADRPVREIAGLLGKRHRRSVLLRRVAAGVLVGAMLAVPAVSQVAPAVPAAPATQPASAPTPPLPPPVARPSDALVVAISQMKAAPALTGLQLNQIKEFCSLEVNAMVKGTPQEVLQARSALERAASIQRNRPATAAYQKAYTAAINATVMQHINDPDALVRLSLIVMVARVTIEASTAETAPVVLAALGDKQQPVVMWGLQGAREVYPLTLDLPNPATSNQIAAEVLDAVQSYPASESVVDHALDTFMGRGVTSSGQRAGKALGPMVQFLQIRAQEYAKVPLNELPEKVADFPALIARDTDLTAYLVNLGVKAMDANRKAVLGRAIFDLASEMARLGPPLPGRAAGIVAPRREDLMVVLKNLAGALAVLGRNTAQLNVYDQAQKLSVLSTNAPNQAAIDAQLKDLEKEMKAANLLADKPQPVAPKGAAGQRKAAKADILPGMDKGADPEAIAAAAAIGKPATKPATTRPTTLPARPTPKKAAAPTRTTPPKAATPTKGLPTATPGGKNGK